MGLGFKKKAKVYYFGIFIINSNELKDVRAISINDAIITVCNGILHIWLAWKYQKVDVSAGDDDH